MGVNSARSARHVGVLVLLAAAAPASAQVLPYSPAPTAGLSSSPRALRQFAEDELPSLAGRWTDGSCRTRWNDWSVSGLDITFQDQSGGQDVETVIGVERGAFMTQSVEASRGGTGGLWKYQPLDPATMRVQNLSTRTTFLLRRCS